jgi:hypothetical protein
MKQRPSGISAIQTCAKPGAYNSVSGKAPLRRITRVPTDNPVAPTARPARTSARSAPSASAPNREQCHGCEGGRDACRSYLIGCHPVSSWREALRTRHRRRQMGLPFAVPAAGPQYGPEAFAMPFPSRGGGLVLERLGGRGVWSDDGFRFQVAGFSFTRRSLRTQKSMACV